MRKYTVRCDCSAAHDTYIDETPDSITGANSSGPTKAHEITAEQGARPMNAASASGVKDAQQDTTKSTAAAHAFGPFSAFNGARPPVEVDVSRVRPARIPVRVRVCVRRVVGLPILVRRLLHGHVFFDHGGVERHITYGISERESRLLRRAERR